MEKQKGNYSKMTQEKNLKNNLLIDLNSPSTIFNYINNGITVTDDNSTILYTNPAFTKITGYTAEEVKGKNPGMLHSGQHDKHFYEQMWQSIIDHGFWEGEIWNRRKTGEIFPEFLTISKVNQFSSDKPLYIAIFSDISFLKKDIEKKLHLAFYDPLTELPNRALYLDRVNKSVQQTNNSTEKNLAVFYMDLDKFKPVNDAYGHCVGDELLKMVGQRLAAITRAEDTIARIGGDEFAVILTFHGDKKFVSDFSKRIINSIEEPFLIDGNTINISISIGISFYPYDTDNIDTLLINADKAMYVAKKKGSKIEYYNNSVASGES